ncbi:MAG: imidazole glycerol phosphate synthase subunit HisH [Actinomycetia bacterium]|nr:imidazole glycerol phosphate synthase subunit HisH [Actinomycetes bacterium]
MIAVVDLALGNLNSVRWALERVGADVVVTRSPDIVAAADGVVLPGVGNFAAGAERLRATGLDRAVRRRAEDGVPLLGICLGMQLFFEGSEEGGEGLGLLPGRVALLDTGGRPLPHMGWNTIEPRDGSLPRGEAYFCHSYAAVPDDPRVVAAETEYGGRFVSAVRSGRWLGVQFHPEKSGVYGRRILAAFLEEVEACSKSSRPSTSRPDASSA